jgi:small subunit ribosomal protein S2
MTQLSVKALVDAGAHIGCRVGRWNPKMAPFILESRNRIHLIDLKQTIRGILRAKHFLREVIATGDAALFVGTKQQVRGEVRNARERVKMPYVCDRWIGGTLTNYEVIGSRIAHLETLEKQEAEGYLATLSKKEGARFNRDKAKMLRNLDGIRDMFRLPGVMIVVDPKTERKAVREAHRMGIPVIGIVDTDCDPSVCDIVIPANDDAIRSVSLILGHLFSAVEDGLALRKERGITTQIKREVKVEEFAPVPRPRKRKKGMSDGKPPMPQPRPRAGKRVPMEGGVNRPVEITPHEEPTSVPAAAAPKAPAPEAAAPEAAAPKATAPKAPAPEATAPPEKA